MDTAVSICQLKRLVADADLGCGSPYLPPCRPASGKRVAIVGGGPTGLSAAYYLTQQGHACTVLEENEHLGGRLHRETTAALLPREVLDAEIATIPASGNRSAHAPTALARGGRSAICGRISTPSCWPAE